MALLFHGGDTNKVLDSLPQDLEVFMSLFLLHLAILPRRLAWPPGFPVCRHDMPFGLDFQFVKPHLRRDPIFFFGSKRGFCRAVKTRKNLIQRPWGLSMEISQEVSEALVYSLVSGT